MITRETDLTKQESSTHQDFNASTTSSWSRLKDPRIVRVCRAFGGKDRHSKVCTVKGLRDRRVRLSVPTAIQLYDLQDRLGLNQPSKVVDWLLNAAKHEIDELPPLQFPQGGFSSTLFSMANNSSEKPGGKLKGVSEETSDQEGRDFNLGMNNQDAYVANPSSLVNSSSIQNNSFVRWEASNLTLSHPISSPPPHHHQDWHNFSLVPMQPTSSSGGSHHQVLVYQPAQPYFHSQISSSYSEFDAKHMNFQSSQVSTSSLSSSASVRPIHLNMTANLLPSQNDES